VANQARTAFDRQQAAAELKGCLKGCSRALPEAFGRKESFEFPTLHQTRHCSEFLAFQLKARQEGLTTPVCKLAASRHKRWALCWRSKRAMTRWPPCGCPR